MQHRGCCARRVPPQSRTGTVTTTTDAASAHHCSTRRDGSGFRAQVRMAERTRTFRPSARDDHGAICAWLGLRFGGLRASHDAVSKLLACGALSSSLPSYSVGVRAPILVHPSSIRIRLLCTHAQAGHIRRAVGPWRRVTARPRSRTIRAEGIGCDRCAKHKFGAKERSNGRF